MSEIKLKDFILEDIPDPKKKVIVTREQPEYDFKVEYENDTDFILTLNGIIAIMPNYILKY